LFDTHSEAHGVALGEIILSRSSAKGQLHSKAAMDALEAVAEQHKGKTLGGKTDPLSVGGPAR
jgi:hypothetical protein